MDITANREFGQLMYDLVRGRMVEVGFEPPALRIERLGDFLHTAAREVGKYTYHAWWSGRKEGEVLDYEKPPIWLEALVELNPFTHLLVRTFLSMVWLSLLTPDDERRAQQVIPHTAEYFERRKYRPLSDEETAHLIAQVIELNARQQRPKLLGAAGDALLISVRRPLSQLSAGKSTSAKRRRQTFMRTSWQLCHDVEVTRELAERKALAAQLGEKLEAELRASHATELSAQMDRFGEEFDLFFSGSQLAK